MSDIVLSAGVRANLLQLQNTAELVTSTQNKLATGKRVNSALDNPVNFFTEIDVLLAASAPAGSAPLPGGEIACALSQCVLGFSLASTVHWLGAAAFFGALAVFCLVLFVRGSEGSTEKAASNRIYRVCGWTIVGSMAAIAVAVGKARWGPSLHPVRSPRAATNSPT